MLASRAPQGEREAMKKVILIVLGAIAGLIGLGLVAGGIALAAVFGPDGRFESDSQRLDTATYALLSEPVRLQSDAPMTSDYGGVKVGLRTHANGDRPVFVGIGPTGAVNEYLRGVAVDVVTEWHYSDSVQKTRVNGESAPEPPTAQPFWLVKASGSEPQVNWKLRNGSYRLVVMNADASKAVDVDAKWRVEIPWIFPLGIGLLIAGVIAIGIGILLLVLGIRARTSPPPVAPTTAGAWTAPGAQTGASPPPPAGWPPPPQ
jgi:hypothetical protein